MNAPPTTHIYTLSLHDALPISRTWESDTWNADQHSRKDLRSAIRDPRSKVPGDRKSTRLNSSHVAISYAVFCLKKKKKNKKAAMRKSVVCRKHSVVRSRCDDVL